MLLIGASVACECGTIISIYFNSPQYILKCPKCKKRINTETWEGLLKLLILLINLDKKQTQPCKKTRKQTC